MGIAVAASARPGGDDRAMEHWDVLPMPAIGKGTIESTAIVGVDGQLVLAVGMRRGNSERVRFWRLGARRRWHPVTLDRPVVRDLSNPLHVAEFRGRACATVRRRQRIRLACVAPNTGAVTMTAAVPTGPSPIVSASALATISGAPYVTVIRGQGEAGKPGAPVAVTASEVLVFRFDGTSWAEVSIGDEAGSARGGQLADIGAKPCTLLLTMPSTDGIDDAAAIRCGIPGTDSDWQATATPFERRRRGGFFSPHSLASVAGDPLVGIIDYAPAGGKPNGEWSVMRFRDGQWTRSPLTVRSPHYLAQGHLYTFDDEAWSFVFEQRPIGGNRLRLKARLRVQRLSADGAAAVDVGRPLVDGEELQGPIDYGLAKVRGRIYASYLDPDRRQRRNLPSVALLR